MSETEEAQLGSQEDDVLERLPVQERRELDDVIDELSTGLGLALVAGALVALTLATLVEESVAVTLLSLGDAAGEEEKDGKTDEEGDASEESALEVQESVWDVSLDAGPGDDGATLELCHSLEVLDQSAELMLSIDEDDRRDQLPVHDLRELVEGESDDGLARAALDVNTSLEEWYSLEE